MLNHSSGVGRRAMVAAACVVAAASMQALGATSLTWSGTTSGNWSDATNWGGAGIPDGTGDALTFPSIGGTRAMTNDIAGVVVNSITVTSGLYSLTGTGITFDGANPIFTNGALGSGDAFVNNETVTLNTTTTFANTSATRLNFSGDVTGVGGVIINATAGVVRFTTAKTYAGDTTISAGTLDMVTAADLPHGAGTGNVTIASGATLLDENLNINMNGLNGAGAVSKTGSNTRTITIGNNDANGNFTGTITSSGGSSALTKTGAGTQILGGAVTLVALNANGGTLLINNTVTGATATVAAAGTLGGTGTSTLTGAFTSNGTVAPGSNGIGAMAVSAASATLSATSKLAIEIGGNTAGTGYDQLNLTNAAGTVTLDPAATLNASLVNAYVPAAGDVDYILTRADAGSFANGFAGLAEGGTVSLGAYTAQITYQANWTGTDAGSTLTGGNDVALYNFKAAAPIPEPASLGVLVLGGASLLIRRRRR